MHRHSQRKKPAFAIPSTMIIMPAIKIMVSQLIPDEAPPSPTWYQKSTVKMLATLSVSQTAVPLCMHKRNTITIVSSPAPSVIHCLSILSITIRTNIATNIVAAKI